MPTTNTNHPEPRPGQVWEGPNGNRREVLSVGEHVRWRTPGASGIPWVCSLVAWRRWSRSAHLVNVTPRLATDAWERGHPEPGQACEVELVGMFVRRRVASVESGRVWYAVSIRRAADGTPVYESSELESDTMPGWRSWARNARVVEDVG